MTKDTSVTLHKFNKVKPTDLQLRAFNLAKANPKWSWAKVMREAGFKGKSPSQPTKNLLTTRGFLAAQALWPAALAARGIYMETLAAKYASFLRARKYVVAGSRIVAVQDHALQFKAAESLKRDLVPEGAGAGMEEKSVTFRWKKPV